MKKSFFFVLTVIFLIGFLPTYAAQHNAYSSALCETFENKLLTGTRPENATISFTGGHASKCALAVQRDGASSAICARVFMKSEITYEISAWIKGETGITFLVDNKSYRFDSTSDWQLMKALHTHSGTNADTDVRIISDADYVIDDLTIVPDVPVSTDKNAVMSEYCFDDGLSEAAALDDGSTKSVVYNAEQGYNRAGAVHVTSNRNKQRSGLTLPVNLAAGIIYNLSLWVKVDYWNNLCDEWRFTAEIDEKKLKQQ